MFAQVFTFFTVSIHNLKPSSLILRTDVSLLSPCMTFSKNHLALSTSFKKIKCYRLSRWQELALEDIVPLFQSSDVIPCWGKISRSSVPFGCYPVVLPRAEWEFVLQGSWIPTALWFFFFQVQRLDFWSHGSSESWIVIIMTACTQHFHIKFQSALSDANDRRICPPMLE